MSSPIDIPMKYSVDTGIPMFPSEAKRPAQRVNARGPVRQG